MNLWPHQQFGITEALAAIARGCRRILLTSPTGGGKSKMICEIIDQLAADGWYAVLYSNRKMLVDQLASVLRKHGIEYGVRAAGWSDEGRFEPVQISSLPTERSRVLKQERWRIHGEGRKCLAVVDEAHLNDGPTAQKMFALHDQAGHVRLGVSATPLGLGGSYDELIVAGVTSELRACGALVPAFHYGPDEPDLKSIGRVPLGEDLSENEVRKVMGGVKDGKPDGRIMALFGRVLEWFERLNPNHRPSILFAPGVAESIWFAEQFQGAGISAAHIDGAEVWVEGSFYRSDAEVRQQVLEGSRDGRLTVLCNRFVLREGIDCPWLAHGVFATVFGSLQSYLQSGGRLLRAHPSLDQITIQDHGGNWWRHGSLNFDREWRLEYTGSVVSALREDKLRKKIDAEPVRCPECAKILHGFKCPCGWEAKAGSKRSRPVIQADGSLKQMNGDIFRKRAVCKAPNGPALWERMYYRSRTDKGARTFRAAAALFASENGWQWPDPAWPMMPTDPMDWHRLVADVPREKLTPKE